MKEKNMADSKLKKEIERGSYKNCIRIKGAREHNLKWNFFTSRNKKFRLILSQKKLSTHLIIAL